MDDDVRERGIYEEEEDIELEEENDEDEEDLEVVVACEELLVSCELEEEELWGLRTVDLLLLDDVDWALVDEKLDSEDDIERENIDVEIDELVEDNNDVRGLEEDNAVDETLDRCIDELLEDGADIITLFEELIVDDPSELIDNEEELCCPVCIVWLLFPLLLIFWANEHDNSRMCMRNFLISRTTIVY